MEPLRGPPANGAEPSRAVGTVKVYLPNKQRTVVSLTGQNWQGRQWSQLQVLDQNGWEEAFAGGWESQLGPTLGSDPCICTCTHTHR